MKVQGRRKEQGRGGGNEGGGSDGGNAGKGKD